jgi:hypothetical protein
MARQTTAATVAIQVAEKRAELEICGGLMFNPPDAAKSVNAARYKYNGGKMRNARRT